MKIDKGSYDLLLAKKCLSKSAIAKLAKVSRGTISKMLLGEEIRPQTIGKIAIALDADVENIIEKEGSDNT